MVEAVLKPEDQKMLDALSTAIAGATGEDKADVLKKFTDQAKKQNGGAALDAAMEEFARQEKAGKVAVADKAAVDGLVKEKPLMAGRLTAARNKAAGAGAAPAGRPPLPNAAMKPAEKELLDKLVKAVANGTGEKAEDIMAPAAGKRAEEQLRNAVAQYAVAAVNGDIKDADKLKPQALGLKAADMKAALEAAKFLKDAPKGVKDNMTAEDVRKAVTLAQKDPKKFAEFMKAVKDAGGDRAKQKAAADALKEVIRAEAIAMAVPDSVRVASLSRASETTGPNGARQPTGRGATGSNEPSIA